MSAFLVAVGLAAVLSVLAVLFAVNLAREGGDAAEAASRTTEGIGSVTAGVVVSGVVLATELIGTIIGIVFAAPEAFTTILLGVVGYLSLSGILAVEPESWALLVIVAFVIATLGRDVWAEVSSR